MNFGAEALSLSLIANIKNAHRTFSQVISQLPRRAVYGVF